MKERVKTGKRSLGSPGRSSPPGLALSADKKTMEERVRGVFARSRSTALAVAAAFVITALALILCFTTVLRPVKGAEVPVDPPAAEVFSQEDA